MFYVGRSESLAATVHLSGSGSMTLCGLLVPLRDHLGRAWWCQEFSTPSIADSAEAHHDRGGRPRASV